MTTELNFKEFTDQEEALGFLEKIKAEGKCHVTAVYTDETRSVIKVQWIPMKKYIAEDGQEYNDECWLTYDYRMLNIQDLSEEHAKNILRMVIRNSKQQAEAMNTMMDQLAEAMLGGDDSLDDVADNGFFEFPEPESKTLH